MFFNRCEKDMVNSIDEIYDVGVFAQIHEIQDLNNNNGTHRLLINGHRRIRVTGQHIPKS